MITKLLSQKYVYVGITGAAAAILFVVSLSPEPVMSSHTPDDVVCSGCVGTVDIASGAVTNAKIANGAVTNGKIASNAVTTTKIFDGTIGYADLSRSFVAVEHRDDCNCGGTGWDPNGSSNQEVIFDGRITQNSVVAVTTLGGGVVLICSTTAPSAPGVSGYVVVTCNGNMPNGFEVNYAIFNNPAYG